MDKDSLRNMLFDKYFEVDDGVLASELVNRLSFISNVYKELHLMCEKNIKYFDQFSSLKTIKLYNYDGKKYLILKTNSFNYVVIDIENNKLLIGKDFYHIFDDNFIVDKFNMSVDDFKIMAGFRKYNGDLRELVDFYLNNEHIFSLSNKIYYKIKIDDAYTCFNIDFVNANAQIGFRTPDQFLYEHLFLNFDLTASKMQDAQSRIGIERMNEMFEKVKYIKIPTDIIPNDLLEQYLNYENNYKVKIK